MELGRGEATRFRSRRTNSSGPSSIHSSDVLTEPGPTLRSNGGVLERGQRSGARVVEANASVPVELMSGDSHQNASQREAPSR